MDQPLNLLGALPETLASHLRDHGVTVRDAETRRIIARVFRLGRLELTGMPRPVPRAVERAAEALCVADRPELVERVTDPSDQSVRYLFRAGDGLVFEAVRIGLHKPGHSSVCLSSQVGCAMGCDFCATGRLGLSRNLAAHEMVGAFCAVRDEAPGPVTGAVFMGQGEPFHNYDAVLTACAVLSHPCGARIAQKAITISTVGLVPRIRQFTAEGHKYRLIVSLTSAIDARRARWMPVASRWPLDDLAAALRERAAATRDRVTLAWVLMGGINHGPDEVDALRARFDGLPFILNLIDINDSRPDGLRRATEAERNAFLDALQVLGVPLVRRYSVGQGQDAACGMLAARSAVRSEGRGRVEPLAQAVALDDVYDIVAEDAAPHRMLSDRDHVDKH